ncbi:MAG: hypothetical protein A3Q59_04625 [Methanomethylophilus alvi]|nr:MAG: hypothetical protein A3Q59_04625 [Methanomethylophilus alvi]
MLHRVANAHNIIVDVHIIDFAIISVDDLLNDIDIVLAYRTVLVSVSIRIFFFVPCSLILEGVEDIDVVSIDVIIVVGIPVDRDVACDFGIIILIIILQCIRGDTECCNNDYCDNSCCNQLFLFQRYP